MPQKVWFGSQWSLPAPNKIDNYWYQPAYSVHEKVVSFLVR